MTINYIDYSDLIEVLDLGEEWELMYNSGVGDPNISCIQDYLFHVEQSILIGESPEYPAVRKCREWLTKFVNCPTHFIGGITYRKVWSAALKIEDDYSFIKFFRYNIELMWD